MKKESTLGLYLHIPFCIRKCGYCDFLSAPGSDGQREEYVEALLKEIQSYQDEPPEQEVDSVFLGGGTPSLLTGAQLGKIFAELRKIVVIRQDAEITMECNPGTLDRDKLESYRNLGVNRLSIGLQSANNRELKLLGRIHTWEEFLQNYYLAREVGFSNINFDLMSGLPGQRIETLEQSLYQTAELSPEHLSVYSLILEEGTPFFERYRSGEGLPPEEEDRRMYDRTGQILKKFGYERYEISNYARPGLECRHNNRYWQREEYLGFGLGASSFYRGERFRNEARMAEYLKLSSNAVALRREIEHPAKREAMGEMMFLGLRRMEGVSKQRFYDYFQEELSQIYERELAKLKACGCLEETEEFVRLTRRGIDVSNSVMCEFMP